MNNQVEDFIQTKVLPQYRPIVTEIRKLMSEFPELKEEMRGGTEKYFGTPVYRYKRIVAVISPSKKGITLAFSKGASFTDSYGLLEGVGNAAKNVRMKDISEFNREAITDYIKQGIAIDKQ